MVTAKHYLRYRAGKEPLAKKVKILERQVRASRPEMRTKTWSLSGTITAGTVSVTNITAIDQGDGVDERSGDRLRLHRVEVRGVADSDLDIYLIQQHGPNAPALANFTSTNGAYILDSDNNNQFTEWVHYRNIHSVGSEDPVKFSKRFHGMIVKFNGSAGSNDVQNGVVLCVLNRNAADSTARLSIRIWFTDP